jgi:hypothetical protein
MCPRPHSPPPARPAPQIGSTILAQAAGVPTLAWSGSGVAVSFEECHGNIPKDIYDKVCGRSSVRVGVVVPRCARTRV